MRKFENTYGPKLTQAIEESLKMHNDLPQQDSIKD